MKPDTTVEDRRATREFKMEAAADALVREEVQVMTERSFELLEYLRALKIENETLKASIKTHDEELEQLLAWIVRMDE